MTAAVGIQSVGAPAQAQGRSTGSFIRHGFWAVADQGLFAGSNCVINVMLARWLSPTDYGAFVTAFAAFLGLGVIHTALLTEPMLLFAAEKYRNRHKEYFGVLLYWHVVVSVAASVLLLVSGWFLKSHGQDAVGSALYWFALAGPFILFLWLMRRACYGEFNPRRAAIGGVGYLIMMMSGLGLVHLFATISVPFALTIIAVSSLAAGLGLGIGHVSLRPDRPLIREATIDHMRYGRWATATLLLGFIPTNIYYFLLPTMASLGESGALRALTNLFMPLLQAGTALCTLLLPAFVRTRNTAEGKRLHRLSLLLLAGLPVFYWLILGVFDHRVVALVYGGKYGEYSSLLWILGLQPIIAGMCGVYGALLRAREKLNAVFWGGVVAAVGAVTLGVLFTKLYGMAGVCWSIVITYGLHHITLWIFSKMTIENKSASREMELPENLIEVEAV
jgi:O-antigen/teichoic acid export membrane protein